MPFRDQPIKLKLIGIITLTSLSVLTLACAVLLTYEIRAYKETASRTLSTVADVVAENCSAALIYDVPKEAQGYLASLRTSRDCGGGIV